MLVCILQIVSKTMNIYFNLYDVYNRLGSKKSQEVWVFIHFILFTYMFEVKILYRKIRYPFFEISIQVEIF